jgi:hypothetical protein
MEQTPEIIDLTGEPECLQPDTSAQPWHRAAVAQAKLIVQQPPPKAPARVFPFLTAGKEGLPFLPSERC